MVTQKEIAQILGVSRETVKFALNGNGKVSPATRARVLQEAKRLGYSPTANMNARTLAARRNGSRAKTHALGVLCSTDSAGRSHHLMPYFMRFWEGIEEEAVARNMDVALYLHRAGQLPRLLRDGDVDGVILLTPPGTDVVEQITVPVVALGSRNSLAHNVVPDGRAGMALAVGHLVELGHRRIAYLGAREVFSEGCERAGGFRDSLREAGLLDESLVEATAAGTSVPAAAEAMRRLLARTSDFTAVVCYNDGLALGAIEALHEAGARVPQDVSIVGFDDTVPESPWRMGLTSVGFDAHAMGRKAVELVDTEGEIPPRLEVFPVRLAKRSSCAAPVEAQTLTANARRHL